MADARVVRHSFSCCPKKRTKDKHETARRHRPARRAGGPDHPGCLDFRCMQQRNILIYQHYEIAWITRKGGCHLRNNCSFAHNYKAGSDLGHQREAVTTAKRLEFPGRVLVTHPPKTQAARDPTRCASCTPVKPCLQFVGNSCSGLRIFLQTLQCQGTGAGHHISVLRNTEDTLFQQQRIRAHDE